MRRFTSGAMFAAALLLAGSAWAAGDVAEKAKLCATCHGEQGIPINKQTPVIWGQDEGYVYLQLRDFKSGARKNPLMGPIAATLEKEDMLALAAYFKKKKWPNLEQPSAPGNVTKKAETAAASIGCRGCHLEHFQGDGSTARLAGQWQEYLQATMMGFRDGSRGNNPGMSDLMKATSPDDIAALSQYLAGLQIDAYLGHGR
ncbi:MAG: cytochrome c [Methyloceanibacter sp.]